MNKLQLLRNNVIVYIEIDIGGTRLIQLQFLLFFSSILIEYYKTMFIFTLFEFK